MIIKHLVNIILLPVTVVVIFPFSITFLFGYDLFWGLDSILKLLPLVLGFFFIFLGLILLILSISLFISEGNGTIAPWNPTSNLITIKIYNYVRNPMILGVFLILIAESLLIGSFLLTIYTFLFILGNLFYIPMVEEQKLVKRFGKEYQMYLEKVPRWIPRRKE